MIPLIAIMTALTTVLTMLVKLPTPTRGYLNLSDAMIFFSAYAFGPWVGGVIGGLDRHCRTCCPVIHSGRRSLSSSTGCKPCSSD